MHVTVMYITSMILPVPYENANIRGGIGAN